MSIIIVILDSCIMSCVFNIKNVKHDDFSKIKKLIDRNRIKIPYGGMKYNREIKNLNIAERNVLNELRNKNIFYEIENEKVDYLQAEIEKTTANPNFDDPHIIAMQIISKALLICTTDNGIKSFFIFIKKNHPNIFTRNNRIPKFYMCNNDKLIKHLIK